ncbi:hypothetical protein OF83DRAFT_1058722 [Amylostereum chailletii]|nr:hypothetical protein OF83DRAFT_1058722 [Amylostereum chailletii]
MPSAATSTFLSILGWSLLPSYATDILLRFIVVPYLGIPPTPLTRRLTYAVVVFSYLVYNFVSAASSMPPNFYDWLGVPIDVDESGLKLAFRAFARRFHPDRVGPQGTMLFTVVRAGYEALMDPAKRWAYDRFGPEILAECQHCVTPRDYLMRGLIQSLGFHIGSGVFLVIFTAIGQKSSVAYWRYTLFFTLAAAEIAILFAPSPSMRTVYDRGPNILAVILPTRLPYQHIRFLHQIFVFLSVGLSRVVPVLFPSNGEDATNGLSPAQTSDMLMRAKTIDAEGSSRL